MPELRYYEIVQEREIKISAINETEAAILAERIFSGTMKPEDQINIQQRPRVVYLSIREDH